MLNEKCRSYLQSLSPEVKADERVKCQTAREKTAQSIKDIIDSLDIQIERIKAHSNARSLYILNSTVLSADEKSRRAEEAREENISFIQRAEESKRIATKHYQSQLDEL